MKVHNTALRRDFEQRFRSLENWTAQYGHEHVTMTDKIEKIWQTLREAGITPTEQDVKKALKDKRGAFSDLSEHSGEDSAKSLSTSSEKEFTTETEGGQS